MALAGAFLLGEGGAPAVLLFRIPHSRLHQLRVNECNRDVSPIDRTGSEWDDGIYDVTASQVGGRPIFLMMARYRGSECRKS
jgi:hypothetical protein